MRIIYGVLCHQFQFLKLGWKPLMSTVNYITNVIIITITIINHNTG